MTNFTGSISINSWFLPTAIGKHSISKQRDLINFEYLVPAKVVLSTDVFLHCYSNVIPLCLSSKETCRTLKFDFKPELDCS